MDSRVELFLDEIEEGERVLLLFCTPSLSSACRDGMKFLGVKERDKTKTKSERIPWKNEDGDKLVGNKRAKSCMGEQLVTKPLTSDVRWKSVYHRAIAKIPRGWKWNNISGIPHILHDLGFTLYEVGWQILVDVTPCQTLNLCRTIFHYEHNVRHSYSQTWRDSMEDKLQKEFFEQGKWGMRGFVNEDPYTGHMYVSLNFDSHKDLINSRSSLNICRTKHA